MTLPKMHSITKKMTVALLGGFLLIFLLFHMCANLMILKNDGGDAYNAFCHFMGSNIIVKVLEIILLGIIALHILLTLWLAICNKMARPVGYHKTQKSKTHTTSKLMVWSGVLIFCALGLHFYDFYLVKMDVVKGEYMAYTESLQDEEMSGFVQLVTQMQMDPEEMIAEIEQRTNMYAESETEKEEAAQYISGIRDKLEVMQIVSNAYSEGNISKDGKRIYKLTHDQRETIESAFPNSKIEPDFYHIAWTKFKVWHIALCYLIFFAILFIHMLHAFPSAFQTLGLNNYKYNRAIELCGRIYACIICLGFAIIPIAIYLS